MKTQLRHKFLKMRDDLSKDTVSAFRQAATKNFFAEGLENIPENSSIMLYSSFRNEADTSAIIDRLFSMGKKIILPRTVGSIIIPHEYKGPDLMKKDSFGILYPDEALCPQADVELIHTVIIPGIAFDLKGNRLGFGRGYYDRFLPGVPNALKIGLCYDFQITGSVPTEENDIPMDFLLTESGLISCKK